MKHYILHIKKIILLICFIPLFLNGQTNIELKFSNQKLGNEYFDSYKNLMTTKQVNPDTVIHLLNEFLLDRGYLEHEIFIDSLFNDSTITIKFRVYEGKKFIISEIEIIGDRLLKTEVMNINSIFKNSILNQNNIKKISSYIVDLLENHGYPFAEVDLTGIKKIESEDREAFVKINFNVKENQQAKIANIEITGNRNTKSSVIIREMRLRKNEVFTPEFAKKILNRLNRLNLFSNVSNPEFYFDENMNGILKIEVKEGTTNTFDGIVGYVPSQSVSEKGYLTGQVNVSLRNLFGTMRAFSFRWNQLNRFTQEIEIKYFEPWFFSFPLNITPVFHQFKQDTSYIQRTISGNVDFMFSESFAITFNLSSSSVLPQINYYVSNINRSSSLLYGIGLLYDSRDNALYTRDGIYLKTDFNQVIKKNYLSTEVRKFYQQKGNLTISFYKKLFKEQLVFSSINARVILGDGISITDLFKLGGMNSLRGYQENQFTGSRIFWSNLEYRFFIGYTDYLAIFFDYGYYFRDLMNEKISKFKYGYGVGAGFLTQLGLLKVNYALGEGDTFSKGKIHFGIISLF